MTDIIVSNIQIKKTDTITRTQITTQMIKILIIESTENQNILILKDQIHRDTHRVLLITLITVTRQMEKIIRFLRADFPPIIITLISTLSKTYRSNLTIFGIKISKIFSKKETILMEVQENK